LFVASGRRITVTGFRYDPRLLDYPAIDQMEGWFVATITDPVPRLLS
jgi:hypothetical protein